jgi:hypothetical protein
VTYSFLVSQDGWPGSVLGFFRWARTSDACMPWMRSFRRHKNECQPIDNPALSINGEKIWTYHNDRPTTKTQSPLSGSPNQHATALFRLKGFRSVSQHHFYNPHHLQPILYRVGPVFRFATAHPVSNKQIPQEPSPTTILSRGNDSTVQLLWSSRSQHHHYRPLLLQLQQLLPPMCILWKQSQQRIRQ